MIGNAGNEKPNEAERLAFTQTDDEEREALARLVDPGAFIPFDPAVVDPRWPAEVEHRQQEARHHADRILAAGFRRSEVPEPSTEGPAFIAIMPPSPETEKRWYSMYCRVCGVEEMMADAPDDPRLVARREEHNREHHAEPQGEPSDAQVDAASREIDLRGFHIPPMAVRAALRAAGGCAMSATHTKVSSETWPMDCIENGCDHGGAEYLENCPSVTLDICKECSDRNWDEHEGGVVLWVGHLDDAEDLCLDEFDLPADQGGQVER